MMGAQNHHGAARYRLVLFSVITVLPVSQIRTSAAIHVDRRVSRAGQIPPAEGAITKKPKLSGSAPGVMTVSQMP